MHNKGEVFTPESIKKGERDDRITIFFNGEKHNIFCRDKSERDRIFNYMIRRIKKKHIPATAKRINFMIKDATGNAVDYVKENK